jgi:hypothetical protein
MSVTTATTAMPFPDRDEPSAAGPAVEDADGVVMADGVGDGLGAVPATRMFRGDDRTISTPSVTTAWIE